MEASHNVFVDRRTQEQILNGLATQVLFWYDQDKKKRTRTNGITVTNEGKMIVARATCSRKDNFVRADGRMKVSNRIFGRAQKHCWIVPVALTENMSADQIPEAFAKAYLDQFGDDMGSKRAYNVGKIFARKTRV